jgi:hypothetical protein
MIDLDKLKEISERADKAASAVSDDFGHSVTKCIEWQVSQLYQIDEDVQKLIEVIRVQSEALRFYASHQGRQHDCPTCDLGDQAEDAINEVKKILGEE